MFNAMENAGARENICSMSDVSRLPRFRALGPVPVRNFLMILHLVRSKLYRAKHD